MYGKLLTSGTYPNYRFTRLLLEDKPALDALFAAEKFDAVCNLAAQAGVRYSLTNPQAYIDSNIVGFINILEACRHVGVQNLSYASSSSAPYKIYNIGNNNPVKLLPLQAEDVPATFANVDDLVEDLGYRPATPVQVGIDNFVKWYREFFKV